METLVKIESIVGDMFHDGSGDGSGLNGLSSVVSKCSLLEEESEERGSKGQITPGVGSIGYASSCSSIGIADMELSTGSVTSSVPEEQDLHDDTLDQAPVESNFSAIVEGLSDLDLDSGTKRQKSVLHCFVCGEMYNNPVLISCLHSFCHDCLPTLHKAGNEQFQCPLCKKFSLVSDAGTPNVLLSTLVALQPSNQQVESGPLLCVICHLHKEENVATGQCIDCGDVLCAMCCEKHTFSRQTLNHTVLALDEIDRGKHFQVRKKQMSECSRHAREEQKYFCDQCSRPVCRDCILLEHQSHSCRPLTETAENKRKEISGMLDTLKLNILELENEDSDFLTKLQEEEKTQKQVLDNELKTLIAVLEDKYTTCLNKLIQGFEEKRESCSKRKCSIEKKKDENCHLSQLVNFYLQEGNDGELMALEAPIKEALLQMQEQWKGLCPSVEALTLLPKIEVSPGNKEAFLSMPLFKVLTMSNEKTENKSKPVKPSKPPKRRTHKKIPEPTTSILGAYPGPASPVSPSSRATCSASQQKLSQAGCYPTSKSSRSGGHLLSNRSTAQCPGSLNGKVTVSLESKQTINAKVLQDLHEPDIVGVAFLNDDNFAVSDSENKRIKVFSLFGTFMDNISDPDPLSLTVCDNFLVWNSEQCKVNIRSLEPGNKLQYKKNFSAGSCHPVSCFQGQKYVVANVGKAKVEAYDILGGRVHELTPTGPHNQGLSRITGIATRKSDQLVLIASDLGEVIINDLDGRYVGSYRPPEEPGRPGWEPSCVCIDENDYIFVVDSAGNKVVMLSPRGHFIQEWITPLERPYCVACHGKGLLLVAGAGRLVHLYQYHVHTDKTH